MGFLPSIDIGGREDDLEPALGNSNKLEVKLKRKLQQKKDIKNGHRVNKE